MKLYRNELIGLLGALAMLVSCAENPSQTESIATRTEVLPYYQEATYTPVWFGQNSDSLNDFHQIPAFKLVNQMGDTITEQTFENKIYVANFFFTVCPGICPQMTSNMLLVQDAFKDDDDVLLLSHSVTPNYDSVAILKEYAEANGVIKNKWHLVTGDQSEIYKLGRKAYFAEEDLGVVKGENEFLHTENFVLVDKNKNIRGIYNGLNKVSVNQLISDIKLLKSSY